MSTGDQLVRTLLFLDKCAPFPSFCRRKASPTAAAGQTGQSSARPGAENDRARARRRGARRRAHILTRFRRLRRNGLLCYTCRHRRRLEQGEIRPSRQSPFSGRSSASSSALGNGASAISSAASLNMSNVDVNFVASRLYRAVFVAATASCLIRSNISRARCSSLFAF